MLEFHNQIIDIGQKLGYYSADFEGTCNGYSLKWLEACLLGQEEKVQFEQFKQAIIEAYQQDTLLDQVTFVKTKVKERQPLLEQEQNLLNLLAFYETMELYQSPSTYHHIFNQRHNQYDVEHTSYLAGSEQLHNQGGMKIVYSEIGIYSKNDIKMLLDQFEEAVAQLNYPKSNIAFLLTNTDHAIGLNYKKEKDINEWKWTLNDINNESLTPSLQTKEQLIDAIYLSFKFYYSDVTTIENFLKNAKHDLSENSPKNPNQQNHDHKFTLNRNNDEDIEIIYNTNSDEWLFQNPQKTTRIVTTDTHNLAQEICMYYIQKMPAPYVIFGVSIITSKNDDLLFNLRDQFYQFKQPQSLTPDILQRKHIEDIACVAVLMNDLTKIEQLISLGVNLNQAKQSNNAGLLLLASQYGYVDIIKALIAHVDVNAQNKNGDTAVLMAAECNYSEIIQVLSNAEANLDIPNSDGSTPALIAAQKGHLEAIQMLIQCGADLNKSMINGGTPLFVAAQNAHKDIVIELLAHGSNPDVDSFHGATPIFIAAQNGHADIISIIASYSQNIHKPLRDGKSPLHVAVEFDHIDAINTLIQLNANVNHKDINGITPIYLACLNENIDILKILIDNGADLKERYNGLTLLFIAATRRKPTVVTYLLETGANLEIIPNIKSSMQWISLIKLFKNEIIEQRMEQFIQSKLQTGADPEKIEVLPCDMAHMTGDQDIINIFNLYRARSTMSHAKRTIHQLYDEPDNHSSAPARSMS